MKINDGLTAADLEPKLGRLWEASAAKIDSIERTCRPGEGSPVFTVEGRYTAARLDRVDAGLPVRLGAAAVRRDRRRARFLDLGRGA